MANNRKNVTLNDYSRCVFEQVTRLVNDEGASVLEPVYEGGEPTTFVQSCYENNVSVDACAGNLTI